MTFTTEPTRSAVALGDLHIHLMDLVATQMEPAQQAAKVRVNIVLSDGMVTQRHGDLVPHITTEERTWLLNFITNFRARAAQQIITPP